MSIIEYLLNGFSAILSNKMRSGLTMLGIIIGVSSVIIMLAIGKGAQEGVTKRIQQMGSNLLIITPGKRDSSDVRAIFGRGQGSGELPSDDIDTLKENIKEIEDYSPEYSGRKQIIYKANNMSVSITGVLPSYENVRNFKVNIGRFISEEDVKQNAKVAVLGVGIVQNIFGDKDPIGEDIRMENTIFTVIGVMEEKGSQNQDNIMLVPLSTAQKRIFGKNKIQTIYAKVKENENMTKTQSGIQAVLMEKHKIKNPENIDFTVVNQAEIIGTMNEVTSIFTMLLGGIASVSLIVGGIGVMNIMLVSVTERTKEIGIRKAIGAKNRDILYQFLTESILLSIFGGLIGILISFIIYYFSFKYLTNFTLSMSYNSILISFMFSVSIGIIFGILPAMKAAKLNPIDCLRYE